MPPIKAPNVDRRFSIAVRFGRNSNLFRREPRQLARAMPVVALEPLLRPKKLDCAIRSVSSSATAEPKQKLFHYIFYISPAIFLYRIRKISVLAFC